MNVTGKTIEEKRQAMESVCRNGGVYVNYEALAVLLPISKRREFIAKMTPKSDAH